jgi:outer membrane protein OmpA-like peptidoglycan-associated protein
MKTALKMLAASGLSLGLIHPSFAAETKAGQQAENAVNKVEDKLDVGKANNPTSAAYELSENDITTISFAKGSSTLTETEKSGLRSAYQVLVNDPSVERVIVAAWSDQPLPRHKKLSRKQVSLAEKRADHVKFVLKDIGDKNIDTYNMAKEASWIGKVFETQNAEIKGALQGKPADDAYANRIAQLLESKGGVSKAVVIVKREHRTAKAASNP